MVLYTYKDRVSTKRVYDGNIFNLRVDILQKDTNKSFSREVIEHNGGVVIACQPGPAEILLVRQYRYPIDEELIELPAGRVDKGEDRLDAAQRELIEETGYKAQCWEELPSMYSTPGFCTELLSFYRASDVSFVGTSFDEDEHVEVMRMSLADAWKLVKAGKVRDAKTVACLGLIFHQDI